MTSLGQLLICSEPFILWLARLFIYFLCAQSTQKDTKAVAIERVLFMSRVCVCVKERGRVRLFAVGAATEMSRFSFVELLTGTGGTILS